MSQSDSLDYAGAGVNIKSANQLVSRIPAIAKRTSRPGVLAGIGGFGCAFEIPAHYRQPVLISGTDGVGTKLKLAMEMGRHDTIGIDLVAMCANDILCLGAEPLFFLDYYATGKLQVEQAETIIEGIARGCELAGAALIGGETAEMPGMYQGEDYDLAGFCVGCAEKDNIIDGSHVQAGDIILGLSSSGPHSNGYSLIRKVLEKTNTKLSDAFANSTIGETLLTPTKLYVKSILSLLKQIHVHSLAHITGGGLLENIPRALPTNCQAVLAESAWTVPDIFQWIQQSGNITHDEMQRTFNMGIGMVVIVGKDDADTAKDIFQAAGETCFTLGHVQMRDPQQPQVIIQ